jgi:hypothetical protein
MGSLHSLSHPCGTEIVRSFAEGKGLHSNINQQKVSTRTHACPNRRMFDILIIIGHINIITNHISSFVPLVALTPLLPLATIVIALVTVVLSSSCTGVSLSTSTVTESVTVVLSSFCTCTATGSVTVLLLSYCTPTVIASDSWNLC